MHCCRGIAIISARSHQIVAWPRYRPVADYSGMLLSTEHARHRSEPFVSEEHSDHGREQPTVYLDTTLPSHLVAPMSADVLKARRQRATRVWWRQYRPLCTIFVSDLVLAESRNGREDAAQARLTALESIDVVFIAQRSDALLDRVPARGVRVVSLGSVGLVLSSPRRRAERADCRRVTADLQAAGIAAAVATRRFARAVARPPAA
jgi:hypothetical protein